MMGLIDASHSCSQQKLAVGNDVFESEALKNEASENVRNLRIFVNFTVPQRMNECTSSTTTAPKMTWRSIKIKPIDFSCN